MILVIGPLVVWSYFKFDGVRAFVEGHKGERMTKVIKKVEGEIRHVERGVVDEEP